MIVGAEQDFIDLQLHGWVSESLRLDSWLPCASITASVTPSAALQTGSLNSTLQRPYNHFGRPPLGGKDLTGFDRDVMTGGSCGGKYSLV
jgi:hypothetical protein